MISDEIIIHGIANFLKEIKNELELDTSTGNQQFNKKAVTFIFIEDLTSLEHLVI